MATPRDFLEEDYQPQSLNSPRDFLEDTPQESFGESLKYAIPRVAEDIGNVAYQGFQNIPEYWAKYKQELPGFYSNVFRHPKSMATQGFAGLNEMINALAQSPRNIASYGEKRLNLLPQGSEDFAAKYIVPQDTTEDINQLFGQPQYAGEALFRGIGRNTPLLGAAGQIGGAIPHLTRRGATKSLRRANRLAGDRNIGTLDVNPELIEDARQFLPNTLPNRNALEDAFHGDYHNLFRLQSDLGKHASDYSRSLFSAAERAHGREGLRVRNRILDAMHENLQQQGHHDISSLLREGQRDYRRYSAFRPYRNALGVAAGAAMLPKNALIGLGKKLARIRRD